MIVKSASYKLDLKIIEIAPSEQNSTELCKEKLRNLHPTGGESGRKGAGRYDVYLIPTLGDLPRR